MLASLVTAKRTAAMEPIVVDMIGGGDLAAPIRAAGITVHDLGLKRSLDMPAALLRLTRLIRQLEPTAIQSWLYYAVLLSLWALERSGRRDVTRLYWGVRCSDMDQRQYGWALRWTIAACARRAGASRRQRHRRSVEGSDLHRRAHAGQFRGLAAGDDARRRRGNHPDADVAHAVPRRDSHRLG